MNSKNLQAIKARNWFSRKAFTIMELIIVGVVVGIIAAFFIPSINKTIARQKQRRVTQNMIVMHSAQQIYKAKNGSYWVGENISFNLDEINSVLSLNIINEQPAVDYHCLDAYLPYVCEAAYFRSNGDGVNVVVLSDPIGKNVVTSLGSFELCEASGNPICCGAGCI